MHVNTNLGLQQVEDLDLEWLLNQSKMSKKESANLK